MNITANGAEVEGVLVFSDGGHIDVAGNPDDGFVSVKASAVQVSGKGTLSLSLPSPSELVGREFRIVESSDVMLAPGAMWKAPALIGSGIRAILKAKADGLYVAVEGNGMKVIIR